MAPNVPHPKSRRPRQNRRPLDQTGFYQHMDQWALENRPKYATEEEFLRAAEKEAERVAPNLSVDVPPPLAPSQDDILAAIAASWLNPSLLIRSLLYAGDFLQLEMTRYPQHRRAIRAGYDSIADMRALIYAALNGDHTPTEPVPVIQFAAAEAWLMNQRTYPVLSRDGDE
jgi:hypothetical protein